MNRKLIASYFYVICLVAYLPSVLGIAALCLGLFLSPSSFEGWAILILFFAGLVLMRGYRKIVLGQMSWSGEGWVWGGSFFFNLVFMVSAAFVPDDGLYQEVFLRSWPDSWIEEFSHLLTAGLLIWYPVAVLLSGVAFIGWIDEFRKWPAGFSS